MYRDFATWRNSPSSFSDNSGVYVRRSNYVSSWLGCIGISMRKAACKASCCITGPMSRVFGSRESRCISRTSSILSAEPCILTPSFFIFPCDWYTELRDASSFCLPILSTVQYLSLSQEVTILVIPDSCSSFPWSGNCDEGDEESERIERFEKGFPCRFFPPLCVIWKSTDLEKRKFQFISLRCKFAATRSSNIWRKLKLYDERRSTSLTRSVSRATEQTF